MEDFFRKKLNEPNTLNDNWDLPDADVWEVAQSRLKEIPAEERNYGKMLLFFLLSLLFLTLIGIIIWQSNKIKSVEHRVQVQQNEIEKAKNENQKSEKIIEQKITELVEENNSLKSGAEELANKHKSAQLAVTKHLSLASSTLQSEHENTPDEDELSEGKVIVLDAEKGQFLSLHKNAPGIPQNSFARLIHLPINFIEHSPSVKPTVNLTDEKDQIEPLKKIKRKKAKLEIGYEYSFVDMPYHIDKEGIKSPGEQLNNNGKISLKNNHGFHLAFSPFNNIFLKTGIRRSDGQIITESNFIEEYDKSKEIEKAEGGWENSIKIFSGGSSTGSGSDVGITIDEGNEIQEGEKINLEINETTSFDFYQVPMGLEYFIDVKNFQIQFLGGMQWNRMSFSRYELKVSTDNEDIKIEKEDFIDKAYNANEDFWTSYIGLGANYELTKNLNIRTNYSFDFTLTNNLKEKYSNSRLASRALRVGLVYRFQ